MAVGQDSWVVVRFIGAKVLQSIWTGRASRRAVVQSYKSWGTFTTARYLPRVAPHPSYLHRLSHTKADSERAKSGGTFYAVLARSEIEAHIAEANREGQKHRREIVVQARKQRRRKQEIAVADLPGELQDKLVVTPQGCWCLIKRAASTKVTFTLTGCVVLTEPLVQRTTRYPSVAFDGRRWLAHRLIYTLLLGEIPPHSILLHRCDNPSCVNPAHLVPGTAKDNLDDAMSKGRHMSQRLNGISIKRRLATLSDKEWRLLRRAASNCDHHDEIQRRGEIARKIAANHKWRLHIAAAVVAAAIRSKLSNTVGGAVV